MDMQQPGQGQSQTQMQEGEDFVCPNCHSEIRIRHSGDQSRGYGRIQWTCSCGTRMERERNQQQTP